MICNNCRTLYFLKTVQLGVVAVAHSLNNIEVWQERRIESSKPSWAIVQDNDESQLPKAEDS